MRDITTEDERYRGLQIFMMENGGVEVHAVLENGEPDMFDFYTCIRCGFAPVSTHEYGPAGHLCRGFDVVTGNNVTGGCFEELELFGERHHTMWYNVWAQTITEEGEG